MSLRKDMAQIKRRGRKRDDYQDALQAIKDLDVKTLKKLINKGFDVRQLADDESLYKLDFRRNLLPEADNLKSITDFFTRKALEKMSDDLANGHEILKILAEAGLVLIDSWENYSLYGINILYEPLLPIGSINAGHTGYRRDSLRSVPLLGYTASPEALKIMLSEGFDVNAKDSAGWTALHYVAYFYHNRFSGVYFDRCGMAKILLEAGADVNAQNIDGVTPLMLSLCSKYDLSMFLILMEHGADLEILDKYEHHLEFWNRKGYSFIQKFIDYKIGLSSLNDTILHDVIYDTELLPEKLDALKFFLNYGFDINAQDSNGDTVLMCAARDDNFDYDKDGVLLKFLLSRGADPAIRNNEGKSALDILLDNRMLNPSIMKKIALFLLLKAGAAILDEGDLNFRLPAAHSEMKKFGFKQVDSFADLIRDNNLEDLIHAVKNGFDMDVSDVDDLRLIEAAAKLEKTDLVKECLNNCEASRNAVIA